MAGRGPAPKSPGRRARTNTDPNPITVLRFEAGEQPELPEGDWHSATQAWWKTWAESPMAEHFMAVDWSFLLDTAVFHHAMWTARDNNKSATESGKEVRLRVQDFGSTVAARLRLRMQFAEVDEKESARENKPSSRERRGGLHVLPSPAAEVDSDAVEAV